MSVSAPAKLATPGQSQFLSIAGVTLPLPPDADVSRAYQWQDSQPKATGDSAVFETVPGNYYEIPLALSIFFQTSSAAGNRLLDLRFGIANIPDLIDYPAPASQPASQGWTYSFSAGGMSSYIVSPDAASSDLDNSFVVTAFMPLVLPPGATWGVLGQAFADAADEWDGPDFISIRVPTASYQEPTPPPVTPSLRLV